MNSTRAGKVKWTITVDSNVCKQVDELVASSSGNRSAVVEEALKLWLAKQQEDYDEVYFAANAAELNRDSKSWVRTTSESFRRADRK
jgi:hypothetical protein